MSLFGPPNVDRLKAKKDIDRLIKALNDPRTMREAAAALGELRDERAVQPLLATIGTPESYYVDLVVALGRIGHLSCVPALLKWVEHKHPNVREAARNGLMDVEYHDAGVTAAIVGALQNADGTVSKGAVRELGRIRESGWRGTRSLAQTTILTGLVGALRHTDSDVRRAVLDELQHRRTELFGDANAVAALVALAGDEDRNVRLAALSALSEGRAPGMLQPMLDMLCDSDAAIRKGALEVIGRIGAESAFEKVAKLLCDRDPEVRAAAVKAAGALNGPAAVGSLIEALNDEAETVVRSAACALGKLGDPSACDSLSRLLEDPRWLVRYHACNALKSLRWQPADTAGLAQRIAWAIESGNPGEAAKLGDAAADALNESLTFGPSRSSYATIDALGAVGNARSFALLLKALGTCTHDSDEPGHRDIEAIVSALKRILKRRAADLPMELLNAAASLKDQVIQTFITRDDEIVIGRRPLERSISCEPIRQMAKHERQRRSRAGPSASL